MPENDSTTQIGRAGKLVAGVLMIATTIFAITTLLAYWPNKMPKLGEGDNAWYTATRYEITLVEDNNSGMDKKQAKDASTKSIDSLNQLKDSITKTIKLKTEPKDSVAFRKDSTELIKINDALKKLDQPRPAITANPGIDDKRERIHLNTLLLILVATMGFLGNMIHIAASFTSFVGNETFKKSWILWYFVKPFTAAALAIIVYLIIRAGFLGYGSDPSSISLYGILSLSALAGLFTDNATLKLKEVFDVIFKPRDERDDKLNDLAITSIKPDKIVVNGPNTISLKGKNLDKSKLQVKIENTPIANPTITATSIDFSYTVPEADRVKTAFELIITDENNKPVAKKTFIV